MTPPQKPNKGEQRVKAWAIIPAKRGAKSINHFVDEIKCDYYGELQIPQLGIYPASVRNSKTRAKNNCNGYEKVIPVTIIIPSRRERK